MRHFLLPNDEQSKLAIEASTVLKPQGSLFTLDNQNFYAHASLYMFQMNEDSQEKCIAALQKIASRMSVQHLQEEGYYYQDSGHGKGYIDISFARTEQVDHLQQVVVTTFNELRDDMRESDKNKMADATGIKLENLQKFGYPAIGELFRPHITVARLPKEIEPDLSVLPPSASFDGTFTKIGLFEMGPNGTCIRKIAEFKLGE